MNIAPMWAKCKPTAQSRPRLTCYSDDGADIHMHYLASAIADNTGKREAFNFPFFNTAAEKYQWLNQLQALTYYSSSIPIEDDALRCTCDVYELMPLPSSTTTQG
ncbi:MAG: hypothetical protein WCY88_18140 [Spongiibacteraceae bacterium]